MTPLDTLPADQRAVVELVLRRGRDYDEIARLLSIDRAGVRLRALSALDTLGEGTDVPAPRRALITDYLLGQLPPRVAEDVAARLDREPAEARWAQTVSSALAPLAAAPLPPVGGAAPGHAEDADGAGARFATPVGDPVPAGPAEAAAEPAARPASGDPHPDPDPGARPHHEPDAGRPSSRRGGAILLGLGLVAIIAIVVIIIAATSGGSSGTKSSTTAAASRTPTTAPQTNPASRLLPTQKGSTAQGEAVTFTQGGAEYLAVVALHLAPNATTGTRNFYAVWLTDGAGHSALLGFAPQVTSNGQMRAATQLTAADRRYSKILVTLETAGHPTTPGSSVLAGTITIR